MNLMAWPLIGAVVAAVIADAATNAFPPNSMGEAILHGVVIGFAVGLACLFLKGRR